MRARLALWLDQIRTSFWFLPIAMIGFSVGLSIILLSVDRTLDPGMKDSVSWGYIGGAEGARSLLSTIAGSMITAATVTFSLAAVALSIASQQYGSRVLRNYMRDRITQVLLGTFISTFIYCVLVVRDIHGKDYSRGFVPAISVNVAIGLAVVSLILLVFFIHHISTSIRASQLMSVIGGDLRDSIHSLYPGQVEHAKAIRVPAGEEPKPPQTSGAAIAFKKTGYLQSIDVPGLFSIAVEKDLLIEIRIKPGDHYLEGQTAAIAYGQQALSEADCASIRKAMIFGMERTPAQDVRYSFQQLSEIIVRSLSPAINDPFIALTGIDQLAGAVRQLANSTRSASAFEDDKGKLRLLVAVATVPEILQSTVGHIATYAAQDRVVLQALGRTLDFVAGGLQSKAETEVHLELRKDIENKLRKLDSADRLTSGI